MKDNVQNEIFAMMNAPAFLPHTMGWKKDF